MKESLDLFPAGGIHRRVSARSPQLTGQPRLGGSPIAQDGGLGHAEQLGALRHVEAAEEPALDHQCLTRLEAGERLEGGLETEQLIRGRHWWSRRSEEHTSELQSRLHLVCRLLLEKKKKKK